VPRGARYKRYAGKGAFDRRPRRTDCSRPGARTSSRAGARRRGMELSKKRLGGRGTVTARRRPGGVRPPVAPARETAARRAGRSGCRRTRVQRVDRGQRRGGAPRGDRRGRRGENLDLYRTDSRSSVISSETAEPLAGESAYDVAGVAEDSSRAEIVSRKSPCSKHTDERRGKQERRMTIKNSGRPTRHRMLSTLLFRG